MVMAVSTVMASEVWTTDFSAAQKAATEQNVPILAVFSGSDWCGPCMMLKSKVFDTPEFAEYAKGRLIPVELDFPRRKAQDEKIKAQNAKLGDRYGIRAYPTVLLLSPKGDVYGGFIGGHDQLKDVTTPIDKAIQTSKVFEAAMKKADASQGPDKLKALAEAYNAVPEEFREYNKGLADQIIAADPTDSTGMKAERDKKAKLQAEMDARNELLRSAAEKGPEAFRAQLEEMLKNEPDAETQQQLLPVLFQVQLSMATNDEEFNAALATMDKLGAVVPEDAGRLAQFKANIVSNKDKILENNRKRADSMKNGKAKAAQ